MSTTQPSPATSLRDVERKLFDSLGAISYALQHGMIHRVLLGMKDDTAVATIIPLDPAVQEPIHATGPTPIHALVQLGSMVDHMINVDHQGTAGHQSYHDSKGKTQELRKDRKIILTPGGN